MTHSAFLATPDYSMERFPPSYAPNRPVWEGIVLVQMPRGWEEGEDGWGENSLEVGPYLFYGDSSMLAKIKKDLQGR